MTTLDSSSAVELSMETSWHDRQCGLPTLMTSGNSSRKHRRSDQANADEDEECDTEVWEILSKSFRRVQSVLDQNRVLIQQVNENHQSNIPDNIAKNLPSFETSMGISPRSSRSTPISLPISPLLSTNDVYLGHPRTGTRRLRLKSYK